MRKAGGIVALIGGIFGVLLATVTLLVGGCGAALDAEGAQTVVGLGWGGVAFSFLAVVLGALATSTDKRVGGWMILCALLGIILGGTLVAVAMVLVLIGGILIAIGSPRRTPRDHLADQS